MVAQRRKIEADEKTLSKASGATGCKRAACRLRRAVAIPEAVPAAGAAVGNSAGRNTTGRAAQYCRTATAVASCGTRTDARTCVARTRGSGANADGDEELRCRCFVDRACAAHRARQSAVVDRARQDPPRRG